MVRREEGDRVLSTSRCSSPAGVSPASVSAGAPSSRPQVSVERPVAQAGCQEPLRREPARGPQHDVKPAASTESQPESRASHTATNNAGGAKGPCGGNVGRASTREGMTGATGSNYPEGRKPLDKVRQLQRRLWSTAKRQ